MKNVFIESIFDVSIIPYATFRQDKCLGEARNIPVPKGQLGRFGTRRHAGADDELELRLYLDWRIGASMRRCSCCFSAESADDPGECRKVRL